MPSKTTSIRPCSGVDAVLESLLRRLLPPYPRRRVARLPLHRLASRPMRARNRPRARRIPAPHPKSRWLRRPRPRHLLALRFPQPLSPLPAPHLVPPPLEISTGSSSKRRRHLGIPRRILARPAIPSDGLPRQRHQRARLTRLRSPRPLARPAPPLPSRTIRSVTLRLPPRHICNRARPHRPPSTSKTHPEDPFTQPSSPPSNPASLIRSSIPFRILGCIALGVDSLIIRLTIPPIPICRSWAPSISTDRSHSSRSSLSAVQHRQSTIIIRTRIKVHAIS
jgi:hypothetical protein